MGRKVQQQKKKKRHELSNILPDPLLKICNTIIEMKSDDPAAEQIVADLKKLISSKKVEEQVRIVSSWGISIFGRSNIVDLHSDEGTPWPAVLQLMTEILFYFQSAHLQKGLVGVLATLQNELLSSHMKNLFIKHCSKWADYQWTLYEKAKQHTTESSNVDAKSPITSWALNIVCNVDCILDHPKPVYASAISECFPELLKLMCCALEVALNQSDDTTEDNENTITGGHSEDLKYFSRITLYLMQKYKAAVKIEVVKVQQSMESPISSIASLCERFLLGQGGYQKETLSASGLMTSLMIQAGCPGSESTTKEVTNWMRECFSETTDNSVASDFITSSLVSGKAIPMSCLFTKICPLSRLAILRGIINGSTEAIYLQQSDSSECLLFDTIIPFVKPLCTSSDAPLRFLALQTVELSVRKINDAIQLSRSIVTASIENGEPLPNVDSVLVVYNSKLSSVLEQTLDILWTVWDEPSAAIGHILRDIFDLVLAIHKEAQALNSDLQIPAVEFISLNDICKRLIDAHWLRRGKYPSLTVMLPVVGVKTMREMYPQLISKILQVIHIKTLAHGAGALFSAYTQAMILEMTEEIVDSEIFKPMAEALVSPDVDETTSSLLRHAVANYALLPLFSSGGKNSLQNNNIHDSHSIIHRVLKELQTAAANCSGEQRIIVSRMVSSHVHIVKLAQADPNNITIVSALSSVSTVVRIAAVQMLCVGKKTSELLTNSEIRIVENFIIRNFKTSDTAFKSQHSELLRKWLLRCKESIHRYGKDETDLLKRNQTPDQSLQDRRLATENNLIWIVEFLVASSYANSPLERRCMALELLHFVIGLFSSPGSYSASAVTTYKRVVAAALPTNFVAVLMGSLSESWDKVRVATWKLLELVPLPLPGYTTEEAVLKLAKQAAFDMKSCKIKDADSGSLIWRLLHRRYHIELQWDIDLTPEGHPIVKIPSDSCKRESAWPRHLRSLTQLLERLHFLKKERTRGGFLPTHGVLAAISSIIGDVDLSSMTTTNKQTGTISLQECVVATDWKEYFSQLITTVSQICKDAMRNVAGSTSGDIDEHSPSGVDCRGHAFFADRNDNEGDRLVVVNSWLAVKESCQLIALVIESVSLCEPNSPCELLPVDVIAEAGHFLMIMGLQSKHNGAIAKSCEALLSVCRRVSRCRLGLLNSLPSKWLNELLTDGGVQSSNASRILRRSAGLPHVLLSILDAEDHSTGCHSLVNKTIEFLLDIIEQEEKEIKPSNGEDTLPAYAHKVNALNVMKYIVEDTYLREAVISFSGRCLTLTVEGFSHEVWAVRNSSLILFSALIRRVIGGTRSGAGSTSFRDFLLKYASELPMLLKYLTNASNDFNSRELHPCLYPLLLLFSMLSPSTDVQTVSSQVRYFKTGELDGSASINILSLVDKCHHLKNCMGRMMASRALSPLISTPCVGEALVFISSEIRRDTQNNSLHGRLLQLQQLLLANENLEDEVKINNKISTINSINNNWFGSKEIDEGTVCSVNWALFWEISIAILPTSKNAMVEMQQNDADSLNQFITFCKTSSQEASHKQSTNDIASQENTWRSATVFLRCCCLSDSLEQAANFIIKIVLNSESNLLEKTLLDGLNNYEELINRSDVATALFSSLKNLVDVVLSDNTVANDIQFIDNLAAVLESVSIASRCSEEKILQKVDAKLIGDLWKVRRSVQNQAVAAPIFKVQAGFTSFELKQNTTNMSDDLINQLTEELYSSSHWDQPVDVRLGCVQAIKELDLKMVHNASQQNERILHPFTISLYRVSCILLNDESEDVRDSMAELIYPCPTTDDIWKDVPGLHCPEKAIEHCFHWITHIGGLSTSGLDSSLNHLGGILIHPETAGHSSIFYSDSLSSETPPQLPFASEVVAGQSNVIFELEDHNHHSEDLLTMQLAVKQLLFLSSKEGIVNSDTFNNFISKLAHRLVIEAAAVVAALGSPISSEGRILAFTSIYRLRVAALLCFKFDSKTSALKVFSELPSDSCDDLWLSVANPNISVNEDVWKKLLFLIPRN